MKYYLIREDSRIKTIPHIVNWMAKIDARNLTWGSYHKLPEVITLYVEKNDFTVYPDVLSRPFFMITKELQKILKLYEPNMGYRQIILIDRKREMAAQYFLPHLQIVDCLGEGTKFNMNHSELQHIVLDTNKLVDKEIFQLDKVTNRYVVVSLRVLESFLRRGAMLQYEELEMI